MAVVALICVAAGTWQIERFNQSVRDNDALKHNAHAAAVPFSAALAPLVGDGPTPGRNAIRYRTVTVDGTYLDAAPQFLRNQSLDGINGYYVLNPLRTASGVVLVVRGFVAAADDGGVPTTVPAPPAGTEHVTGRLQTPTSKNDDAGQLSDGQLESINPAQQAARLGAPVYDTYLTLNAGQPGTTGLSVLPDPDLSNPAGGAVEPQHFAYIIQWYLFALLALAAPFAIGRHEVRQAQLRFLGFDPDDEEFGLEPADRPQVGAGAGALVRREDGTLVRPDRATPEQWERAVQLADRYGRSLGIGRSTPVAPRPRRAGPAEQAPRVPARMPDSAAQPHRSPDAYHGAYNDHLWQLALADGATPKVPLPPKSAPPPLEPRGLDGSAPSVDSPRSDPEVGEPRSPDQA